MKKLILFCCLLALTFGIAWTGFCQEDSVERLDNSMFENPRRPGAVFSHDEHNEAAGLEEDCSVCHHVVEDVHAVEGESSEDSACIDCHDLQATEDNAVSLMNAYHRRCRDCHFDAGKGPVMCGQCHKKNK